MDLLKDDQPIVFIFDDIMEPKCADIFEVELQVDLRERFPSCDFPYDFNSSDELLGSNGHDDSLNQFSLYASAEVNLIVSEVTAESKPSARTENSGHKLHIDTEDPSPTQCVSVVANTSAAEMDMSEGPSPRRSKRSSKQIVDLQNILEDECSILDEVEFSCSASQKSNTKLWSQLKSQATKKRIPQTRWSKADDVELFKAFKVLIEKHGLKEEDFVAMNGRFSGSSKKVLEILLEQCKWKGNIYNLRDRIKKILNEPDFTAREIRRLRKLLREEIAGEITLDKVLEKFPGKSIEKIVEYKQNYL